MSSTNQGDCHSSAISVLREVPFEEEEMNDVSCEIDEVKKICMHGEDAGDCLEIGCYDPDYEAAFTLTVTYDDYSPRQTVECIMNFTISVQSLIDNVNVIKDCGNVTSKCEGNTIHQNKDYYWCIKHNGEYSEMKVADVFYNSEFDEGIRPLTMMKTGSKDITLKKVIFNKVRNL